MRQVFLEKGEIVVKRVSEPLLDDYSVLVSVYYSFISSGTELATVEGAKQGSAFSLSVESVTRKVKKVCESVKENGVGATFSLVKDKLYGDVQGTISPIGYSCSGKVVAVGKKVNKIQVGDFVACGGSGVANHADLVCIPENLVAPIKDEKYLKDLSVTTIGAIAMQGLRRAQVQLGETVCILGLGLLGQITVQLAKEAGCKVVGIDLIQERIDLAKKIGADAVYSASQNNLEKEIAFLTDHHGVDCTIITAASKSDAIVQQAMQLTRKKGRVVLVGDVGLSLERSPFYKKEIDFLISCSYGPGRYDYEYESCGKDYPFAYVRWTENRNMRSFVDLVCRGRVDIEKLVSKVVDVSDVQSAYSLIKSGDCLGVVISYLPKEADSSIKINVAKSDQHLDLFKCCKEENIRVGFVGAGGFAKIKLMPIVSKIEGVNIDAIVDANVSNSVNTSRLYKVKHSFTSHEEMLKNDVVDAVVVATPHKFHWEQVKDSLLRGKAVFSEKPMVTTYDQLNEFKQLSDKYGNLPYCVDYNRSFAPYVRKIKEEVKNRKSPLVVHYRMNAGFIPKDHWVQTDLGCGRIIGEACHIFDLFYSITDSKPVSISVESINPRRDDLISTDNFSVQISFADGSICSLLYTSLGNKDFGKERMEVFFDGKSIVMDDFKSLKSYGLSKNFDESSSEQDKGHKYLVKKFFGEVRGLNFTPPISMSRLYDVAKMTLDINRLALMGGGQDGLDDVSIKIDKDSSKKMEI